MGRNGLGKSSGEFTTWSVCGDGRGDVAKMPCGSEDDISILKGNRYRDGCDEDEDDVADAGKYEADEDEDEEEDGECGGGGGIERE